MKKILSAIILIAVLCGCLLIPVSANPSITDHLVCAWDFEGTTAETQLNDKAPSGTVTDTLEVNGTVTIENGIATINPDSSSWLNIPGAEGSKRSADIKGLSSFTVYLKVRYTGTYVKNFVNVMDTGGGISKLYLSNNTGSGSWRIAGRDSGGAFNDTGISGFTKDVWHYYAVTCTLDGTNSTATIYHSTNGDDYTTSSKTAARTATTVDFYNVYFGKCNDNGSFSCSYDDIMIFDTALTAEEVATLSTLKVSEDRVGLVGYQRNDNGNDTYNIRFVSVIDSLDYKSIGFQISVKVDGSEVKSLNRDCEYVYNSITDMDYNRTAAQLGGKYIFAFGFRNVDLIAGEVVFRVTPYYITGDSVQHNLAAAEITYTDGAFTSAEYVD